MIIAASLAGVVQIVDVAIRTGYKILKGFKEEESFGR